MSYDITLGDVESFNYTTNMRRLFIHLLGCDLDYFDGMAAFQMEYILALGWVKYSHMTLEELDTFNPESGWGSWNSAVRWLFDLKYTCRQYSNEIVSVRV